MPMPEKMPNPITNTLSRHQSHESEGDQLRVRTESGVNVLIHGQDTKQLEKTLDELSQHQNAPGLMRMISPLGCRQVWLSLTCQSCLKGGDTKQGPAFLVIQQCSTVATVSHTRVSQMNPATPQR
eukprot:s3103_g5.t1